MKYSSVVFSYCGLFCKNRFLQSIKLKVQQKNLGKGGGYASCILFSLLRLSSEKDSEDHCSETESNHQEANGED